jgi:diaminopimelate epimerase
MKESALSGLPFAKMTGSGNDFVFFDAREVDGALVTKPEVIRAICNRHNGIGADGLVVLEAKPTGADARIRYFNSDGSQADLCGNATLCSTAMSVELGLGSASGLSLFTDAGLIHSRISDGVPEIDLEPVRDVRPDAGIQLEAGERRIGFALAGVPHLVVLVDDVSSVPLMDRGAFLRRHPSLGQAGANVNFVSPAGDGGWRYRTFERGVEGETLACGTGSIATGILLQTWGLSASPIGLWTSSGRPVTVTLHGASGATEGATDGANRSAEGVGIVTFRPSLRGEGRVVFRGQTGSILVAD